MPGDKPKYTEEELLCFRIKDFIDSDQTWQDIKGIIDEMIKQAKDDVYDAIGKVADFDRGYGKGLERLLIILEDKVTVAKDLLAKEKQSEAE